MELAIAEARKCKSEPGKVSPKVGAVVVRDGRVVDVAFRGELAPGDHAEFTLLEKKLSEDVLAGSTLYATLEPCTTRNEPKLPCAEWIIERRIRKVIIGVLDPNRAILGTGELRLRDAGIEIGRFDPDLMAQIEELNRDFIRQHIASTQSEEKPAGPSGPDLASPFAGMNDLPAFAIPTYSSSTQEMNRLGPSSWLGALGGDQPAEITLRTAIAVPSFPTARHGVEVATKIRGQDREEFLLRTMGSCAFTEWLSNLKSSWHWDGDARWEVHGSGQPDLTQLAFRPTWSRPSVRLPFIARLGVLTGWMVAADGESVPAIQVALDLMINLLEVDSERRPSAIRHQTTPPPAPGALSLEEIASYLAELMDVVDLARDLGRELVPDAPLDRGYLGAWIDVSGVQLERVFKLSDLERVVGASGPAGYALTSDWPIPEADAPNSERAFVARMLDEMLEGGGYRGVRNRFDWLRT
jgi:pyrimidine deaminase RibD-like protein